MDSAAAVVEALRAGGHEVEAVRLERDGAWTGPDGAPLALVPGGGLLGADVVFPVLHGPFGEDGTIQGLLELLDVPYVGAGVLASSLCMDKIVFKEVLAAAGVPQVAYAADPRGRVARGRRRRARAARRRSGCPCSSSRRGSGPRSGSRRSPSEGELDAALETAFGHDGLVIAEAFSPGIEVECSVTGLGDPETSLPAEVILQGADWYDYEAKYSPGGVELAIPARVGDDVIAEVRRLARETFLRAGCAGLARVDFFVEPDRVLVNELNTLPGHDRHQRLPEDVGGDGRVLPRGVRPPAGLRARALPRRARRPRLLGGLAEERDVADLDALGGRRAAS